MRSLTILVLCLMLQPAVAQDEQVPRRVWKLGVNGSIDHSYRVLVKNESNEIVDWITDLREQYERPITAFTCGFDLHWDAHRRWGITSGIRYGVMGFQMKDVTLIAADWEESGTADLRYHYGYLSVPLLVRARIGNGALCFEPGIGISADRLHEQYVKARYELANGTVQHDRFPDKTVTYNEWGASAWLELTVSATLSDRWQLRFGNRARYALTQLVDAPISAHLYAIGFVSALAYKL